MVLGHPVEKKTILKYFLLFKSHWGEVPASVSIVEKECDDATNNIRLLSFISNIFY